MSKKSQKRREKTERVELRHTEYLMWAGASEQHSKIGYKRWCHLQMRKLFSGDETDALYKHIRAI